MRALIGIVSVILLAVGAYAYYLHRTLAKMANTPGANLHAAPWEPQPSADNERIVDLGYALCRIPGSISGPLERVDASQFVNVRGAAGLPQITFCPPMADEAPAVKDMLNALREEAGVNAETFFELKKIMLETEPFTLARGIVRGRSQAARDLTLLALKVVTFSASTDTVSAFENEQRGVFVSDQPDYTTIDLYDKKARVSQAVLVHGTPEEVAQIASALANSYQIVGAPKTDAEFEALLESQHIPRASVAPQEMASSEAARLHDVAEELRIRRALQH